MDKYTQFLLGHFNYSERITHLLREYVGLGATENQLVADVVSLICLNTGLSIKIVSHFTWEQILYVNSYEDAIVNELIAVPRYKIRLHDRIRSQISELYICLNSPDLNKKVIDSIKYDERRKIHYSIDKLTVINMFGHVDGFEISIINELSFDRLFSRLFGRRVFEVNGYTTEICKALKSFLGFRTNKDLFKFLGYSSKEDISFKLSTINVLSNSTIFNLKDKNFNDSHPKHTFQSFNAFNRFLVNSSSNHNLVTISIKLLLMISLHNGIRPSLLLKLKWSDVMQLNKEDNSSKIHKSILLDEFTINFNLEIVKIFNVLLNTGFKTHPYESNDDFAYFLNKEKTIGWQVRKDTSMPVFVMNNFNAITQPSLLREIKKGLNVLGFKYAERFETKSTIIMYGRKIIELKGDHLNTLRVLKEHFNLRSTKSLMELLFIDYTDDSENLKYEFKRKTRNSLFEEILYDF